jgi:hypothetical protein
MAAKQAQCSTVFMEDIETMMDTSDAKCAKVMADVKTIRHLRYGKN